MPPSPVEIVFVGANDQTPTSPNVPAGRPFHSAPCACAQSSIRTIPSAAHRSAMRCESNARCPPMCTRKTTRGRCARTFRSRSSNDMQRSSRLQSTNSTRAPAVMAASGVAMKVFDGQRTVSPRTRAHSSAASAAPVQPLNATASTPFDAVQADSNPLVSSPSDHCCDSSTCSHSSWRRARSRWSKPMAKRASAVSVPGASTCLPYRPSLQALCGAERETVAVEQPADRVRELVAAERLLQEREVRVHQSLLVVAAHEEHVPRVDRARQLDAVHLRHHDIRQQNVEAADRLACLARRACDRHVVPEVEQQLCQEVAHDLLVVDDED